MRDRYERIFEEAARHFALWILVRRLNPESYRYIGMPGYSPKPIDCKAKTAQRNVGIRRVAGLVADPTKAGMEAAFTDPSKARREWEKFAPSLKRLGSDYSIQEDRRNPRYGCVMLKGKYLHGDFDLLALIDPADPSNVEGIMEEVRGVVQIRCKRWPEVRSFLNSKLGAEMIQHGSQDLTDIPLGEEAIDAFGPNGEACTILNQYSVDKWYQERFGNRPLKVEEKPPRK